MELRERDVTAADGTRVRLWERTPDDPREGVLFVHGATYPGRAAFDLRTEDVGDAGDGRDRDGHLDADPGDRSWLAATARRGRAAVAVDLRGYGDSERPLALTESPAPTGDPPARAAEVTADVRAALAWLRERTRRIHLVGYSWGTVICGRLLTAGSAPPTASLVQFAPVFRPGAETAARFDPGDPPAAYRTVTREAVAERWDAQLPDGADPAAWRRGDEEGGTDQDDADGPDEEADGAGVDAGDPADDPVLDAFWDKLAASGQADGEADAVRAPNGTLVDLRAAAESAPYDPGTLSVPTLVVRGSLDPTATRADALALYDALGSERAEYAEVSGGTHFLPLEPRGATLFDAVAAFQDRA